MSKTKVDPYKKYIPLADKLTYTAAMIEAFIVMPQVYQIFHDKNAAGLSLMSWTGFEIWNLVWLFYGIVHRDKVIIFYASSYGFVQLWVIVGGLMYGAKWF